MKLDFEHLGECGLIARFSDIPQTDAASLCRRLVAAIDEDPFAGLQDAVPSYASLAVFYDPFAVADGAHAHISAWHYVREYIEKHMELLLLEDAEMTRLLKIPVCYGGKQGPDLDWVAGFCCMTPEKFIDIHTSGLYQVDAVGFLPGFPYIGELPKVLSVPRLDSPRVLVEHGSVGISGGKTGIYPVDSPGGWRIVGRTPCRLFTPEAKEPFFFRPGDRIEFFAINEDEFYQVESKIL